MTTHATATGTTVNVSLAVRAAPEQVWQALTDGDMITGTVLAVEPGTLLRTTFNGHGDPTVAALPESVVTFCITEPSMPLPGVSVLSCEHEGLTDPGAARDLERGWVTILSGLTTLLETGAPLVGPAR